MVSSFTENEILAHVFSGGIFQHCGIGGRFRFRHCCSLASLRDTLMWSNSAEDGKAPISSISPGRSLHCIWISLLIENWLKGGLRTQSQQGFSSSHLLTEYYRRIVSKTWKLTRNSNHKDDRHTHVFLGGRFQHCGGVGKVHPRQICWLVWLRDIVICAIAVEGSISLISSPPGRSLHCI